MKILIKRFAFKDNYTIGRLYVRGNQTPQTYICDSLEPRSANISRKDNEEKIIKLKHDGTIAIPTGTYEIKMSMSATFHRLMPYLTDVKGFTNVLIHPGNYPQDTRGCILVGWNRRKGMVCGSRSAFALIMKHINEALARKEKITVTIKETI